jgi:formate dehydrogenase alpha subunit
VPNLIIDGMPVAAAEGQTVLQAALAVGLDIPHLCHHPDLPPGGHCRLCVVQVDDGPLSASCQLAVREGMSIATDTGPVREAREAALDLILSAHPMQCLTCASNHACKLQQVAAQIGVDEARLGRLRSLTNSAPKDESNPFFLRDPQRCVLCGICVRTCDEVQGRGALAVGYSGAATAVVAGSDVPITESICESCGECVVRCPTGALVHREPRPPAREVRTVCPYCGTGCSLLLGVRGDRVVSVRGEADGPVNRGQLCVKGRYGMGFINSDKRLITPMIRRDGALTPATWDEALDLVAHRFAACHGTTFACIGSARCTNEEVYLTQKFARAVMGSNNVDNCARLCHAPTVTGLKQSLGTGGGTSPIADIAKASCVLVVGSNTTEAHPVVGAHIRRAARRVPLIVVDPRETDLAQRARIHVRLRPGTDVPLLMGMARAILDAGLEKLTFIEERTEGFLPFVQAVMAMDPAWVEETTGVPWATIAEAARLYAATAPAMIVYSLGITEHTHGTDNVLAIANLALLTGNIGRPGAGVMPMRGQNNVQGACDVGCVPDSLAGGLPVRDPASREAVGRRWGVDLPDTPGLTVMEMLDAARSGSIGALYITGMDVAYSAADTTRAQEAIRAAEFVVVQDILLSGTAELADVVLPAAGFAEKDGTFTNLERRVQRVRAAVPPPGQARQDWQIVCDIARRMGAGGFDFTDASQIRDEMSEVAPAFAGIRFDRLAGDGIQWPCPSVEHPGTPRLHVDRFATPSGKARFAALAYRPSAEAPDESYPLVLTTGRSLYHFHLAMTAHVEGLMELNPEELVWVHPDDAVARGVADGDLVTVSSRRGSLNLHAWITDAVSPGTAFMTFHFYEAPTNRLTQAALDPVSKTPEFKVTAVQVRLAGDDDR